MPIYKEYQYEIIEEDNRKTVSITHVDTSIRISDIPSRIHFNKVTRIDHYAFLVCKSLIMVLIPFGVTSIGDRAFGSCESLKSVLISSHVTSIGINVFDNCLLLEEANIYANVKKISEGMFFGCKSLKRVTIPESVTSIGEGAFEYCSAITNIPLPRNIKKIGNRAFWHCVSLQNITLPSTVTYIGNGAFSYCKSLQNITLPSTVTYIGNGAFSYCVSLKHISLPSSITKIGEEAFCYCEALESICIPENVTRIEKGTFWHCESLKYVTINDNVSFIHTFAFSRMSDNCIESFHVSNGNKNFKDIDGILFDYEMKTLLLYPPGREDKYYEVPYETTCIGIGAFSFTNLKSIFIPDSVMEIKPNVFQNKSTDSSVLIRCYKGSYAEKYALEHNLAISIVPKNANAGLSQVIYAESKSPSFACFKCGCGIKAAVLKCPQCGFNLSDLKSDIVLLTDIDLTALNAAIEGINF